MCQEYNCIHPWLSKNDCLEKCIRSGSCPEKAKDDGKRSRVLWHRLSWLLIAALLDAWYEVLIVSAHSY